jgi:hypothetical protein
MIQSLANYFGKVSPVFLDGLLYVLLAWFMFNQSYFGSKDADQFISPEAKFWVTWIVGSGLAICTALKAFRSTSFSEHKARTGQTAFLNNPNTPPK